MKSLKGAAVIAAICISSQAFSSVSVQSLSCSAPRTSDGHVVVGVGYNVQIKTAFDTHGTNPDGSIGVVTPPSFRLVSKVISPVAQPRYEDLTLVSRDGNGNYNLAGQNKTVVVNKNFTKAVINFKNATATCD